MTAHPTYNPTGQRPQTAVSTLASIDAERYANIGRYAGAVALACFEAMGGLERMVEWAQDNPGEYYTKLFPKIIQKTSSVEHSGTVGIDNALDRLAAIEGEFVEPVADREWDL